MPKKPQQARSIESTNRMLDAAESLLREGGPRAMTVEAVVERSGTSMGSFYARFESHDGLLQALHERYLEVVVEENLFARLETAIAEPDLASAVHSFVNAAFVMSFEHRDLTSFFMIFNNDDQAMRAVGARTSQAFADLMLRLVKKHSSEVSHKNLRVAADFAVLLIIGIALESVLHEPGEFTGNVRSNKQITDSTSQAVVAYLKQG